MWLWRVVCLRKSSGDKEVICPGRNSDFVPTQLANKLEEERVGNKMFCFYCALFILWIYWLTGLIMLMEKKAKPMFTCGHSF